MTDEKPNYHQQLRDLLAKKESEGLSTDEEEEIEILRKIIHKNQDSSVSNVILVVLVMLLGIGLFKRLAEDLPTELDKPSEQREVTQQNRALSDKDDPSEQREVTQQELMDLVEAKARSNWRNNVSRDDMTGEVTAYATSTWVSPRRQMSFPYSDLRAVLGVGCKSSREWAYIKFTKAPNLLNTDLENGFNRINTRVRWDDEIMSTGFTQTWGAESIQFRNSSLAIKKIESGNSMLLELSWYGSGDVYFEFDLTGSAVAIKNARRSCRRQS